MYVCNPNENNDMRELPLLFSTPMVQALLNGSKGQTRRTSMLKEINEHPDTWYFDHIDYGYSIWDSNDFPLPTFIKERISPGDRIYVKETYAECFSAGEFEDSQHIIYKADMPQSDWKKLKWSSSMFMPKCAARIFLEVESISFERLLDISKQDAIDEGIERGNPIHSYFSLWDSINGKNSHKINPWVRVIRFKRINP
jgi:hypothetical protein